MISASASSHGTGSGDRAEAGFALVIVLLCLLLLTAVSVVAYHAARGQLLASRRTGEVYRTALAAESAVAWGFQIRGENPVRGVAVPVALGSGALGDVEWDLQARELSAELVLLQGRGLIPSTSTVQRVGRVAWWPDAGSRTMAHRAVVETPSLIQGGSGTVGATDVLGGRPGVPGCNAEPDLDGSPSILPITAGLPIPPEWGREPTLPQFLDFRFGWLSAGSSRRRARRLLGSSHAPSDCIGCWSGLSHAAGDLLLSGAGAGVLFVEGTAVLDVGATWTGLLVAGEGVLLGDGARVTGFVRSGGAVQLNGSASVDGSACAVYRALRASPELLSPIPLPTRSWIPMY